MKLDKSHFTKMKSFAFLLEHSEAKLKYLSHSIMLKPVCLLQKTSALERSKIRTWSFGLCPGRAPASCFGWWWGAGVQPKSERFSLFELLKKRKKRHSENMSVCSILGRTSWERVQVFSPVLLSVGLRRGGTVKRVARFSLGFWSCFMVPSTRAPSYIVELRSLLSGDYPPVTETAAYPLLLSTH